MDWMRGWLANAPHAVAVADPASDGEEYLHPHAVACAGVSYLPMARHTVAHLELGNGPTTLLLVHGFAGSLATWQLVQPALARSFRTVAVDLLGFGASDRPRHVRPEDWTAQVHDVMDALGVERAILVAHSMGGRIALSYAAHMPHRVSGLVLLGSDAVRVYSHLPLLQMLAISGLAHYPLREIRRNPRLLLPCLRQSYAPHFPVTPELLQRFHRPICVFGTEDCWEHVLWNYQREDIEQYLPHIGCPVLLLWGAQDRIIPISGALALQRHLPQAELVVLPHCGHAPHEECPDAVRQHIDQFARAAEA